MKLRRDRGSLLLPQPAAVFSAWAGRLYLKLFLYRREYVGKGDPAKKEKEILDRLPFSKPQEGGTQVCCCSRLGCCCIPCLHEIDSSIHLGICKSFISFECGFLLLQAGGGGEGSAS